MKRALTTGLSLAGAIVVLEALGAPVAPWLFLCPIFPPAYPANYRGE